MTYAQGKIAVITGAGSGIGRAHGTVLDAADKDGMHTWAEQIDAARGHVDIVINNAGVALTSTVEDSEYEDLEWLMGINFWGVVYGTKAFLPLLRRSQQGHLINISSAFGLIGIPTQSAYNAAARIIGAIEKSKKRLLIGTDARLISLVSRLFPVGYTRIIAALAKPESALQK